MSSAGSVWYAGSFKFTLSWRTTVRHDKLGHWLVVGFLCALVQFIKEMATLPELSLLTCGLVWKQKHTRWLQLLLILAIA